MGNNLARAKFWIGKVPVNDSFGRPITTQFVDGRTTVGPWAIMNPESYDEHGMGIGQGSGQHYVKQADGRFQKVAG